MKAANAVTWIGLGITLLQFAQLSCRDGNKPEILIDPPMRTILFVSDGLPIRAEERVPLSNMLLLKRGGQRSPLF